MVFEIRLLKKEDGEWTGFKVSNSDYETIKFFDILDIKPTKVSSRYAYYEVEGNYIKRTR